MGYARTKTNRKKIIPYQRNEARIHISTEWSADEKKKREKEERKNSWINPE